MQAISKHVISKPTANQHLPQEMHACKNSRPQGPEEELTNPILVLKTDRRSSPASSKTIEYTTKTITTNNNQQ